MQHIAPAVGSGHRRASGRVSVQAVIVCRPVLRGVRRRYWVENFTSSS
ncbi:hypothetical protein [Klebsiella pneumoniae IS53]|nr:hypothetical protein [Klebsiella pneumoniae IS53]